MAKTRFILFLLLLLSQCSPEKATQRIFEQYKLEVYPNYGSAANSSKTMLLFVIINDSEKEKYNESITKNLKMDTTKSDVMDYRNLTQYAIIKMYRSRFNQFVNELKTDNEVFKKECQSYINNNSFLFICDKRALTLYGTRDLNSSKEDILDLLWVGMGP